MLHVCKLHFYSALNLYTQIIDYDEHNLQFIKEMLSPASVAS